MNEVFLSAVVIVYNGERFVADAIESILAQTVSPCEVIVVDDGSRDGTADVIRRYGLRVRYIYQENRGEAGARNRGLTESSGTYVAFLDADDQWDREYVSEVLQKCEDNPALGLVFTGHRSLRPPSADIRVYADPLPSDWLRRWHFSGRRVATPSMTIIRKELALRLGGCDESLVACVDQDLYLRAMLADPYHYVQKPLVTMRRYGGNLSSDLPRQWAANKRFYAKHRNTFGHGIANWVNWHRAKSDCRREHAWAYLHRGQRRNACLAAAQAAAIWPFDRLSDWVRLWANILAGEYPSSVVRRVRRMLRGWREGGCVLL